MMFSSFITYLVELLFCVFLVVAVRTIAGRWLGPSVRRLLWVLLIVKALVPLTVATPYHPLVALAKLDAWMTPPAAPEPESEPEPAPPAVGVEKAADFRDFTFAMVPYEAVPPDEEFAPPDEPAQVAAVPVEAAQPSAADTEQPPPPSLSVTAILLIAWGLGAAGLLGAAVWRYRAIIRNTTQDPVAAPDWVRIIFLDCRRRLGLRVTPGLVVSPCIPSPCLVGTLRPRVLIPELLVEQRTPEGETRIRHLLLHELTHLKQGDIWLAWLWTLALAVQWFNPLFWMLGRHFRFDCEAACDDRVMTMLRPHERADYGTSLLHILIDTTPSHATPRFVPGFLGFVPGFLGLAEPRSNLERRLTMMNGHRPPSWTRRLSACVVFLLLTTLCLTSYGQSKPPPAAPAEEAVAKSDDDAKTELKIDYEPGTYLITQTMRSTIRRDAFEATTQANTIEMTVSKPNAAGQREITITYQDIKSEYTEDGQATPDRHNVFAILNAMIGKPVTFIIDAKGNVGKLEGLDKILAAVPDEKKTVTEGALHRPYRDLIGTLTTSLPGKPVEKDESWGSADSIITVSSEGIGSLRLRPTFTLTDVTDGVATVTGTQTIGDVGRPSEEVQFIDIATRVDVATGLVTSATVSLKKVRYGENDRITYRNDDAFHSETTVAKIAGKAPKEAPRVMPPPGRSAGPAGGLTSESRKALLQRQQDINKRMGELSPRFSELGIRQTTLDARRKYGQIAEEEYNKELQALAESRAALENEHLNLSREETREQLRLFDRNGNGVLDEDEFAAFRYEMDVAAMEDGTAVPVPKRNFLLRYCDEDGDGTFTETEARTAVDFMRDIEKPLRMMRESDYGASRVQTWTEWPQVHSRLRMIVRQRVVAYVANDKILRGGVGAAESQRLNEIVRQHVATADGGGEDALRVKLAHGQFRHLDRLAAPVLAANGGKPNAATRAALVQAFDADMRERIKKADANNNGKLDSDEFEIFCILLLDEWLRDDNAATKPSTQPARRAVPGPATQPRPERDDGLQAMVGGLVGDVLFEAGDVTFIDPLAVSSMDRIVKLSDEQKQAIRGVYEAVDRKAKAATSGARLGELGQAWEDAKSGGNEARVSEAEKQYQDALEVVRAAFRERESTRKAGVMAVLTAEQRVAWRTDRLLFLAMVHNQPFPLGATLTAKLKSAFADRLKDDAFDPDEEANGKEIRKTLYSLRNEQQAKAARDRLFRDMDRFVRDFRGLLSDKKIEQRKEAVYTEMLSAGDGQMEAVDTLIDQLARLLTDEQKDALLRRKFANSAIEDRAGRVVIHVGDLTDEQDKVLLAAYEATWNESVLSMDDVCKRFDPFVGLLSAGQKEEAIRTHSVRYVRGKEQYVPATRPAPPAVVSGPDDAPANFAARSEARLKAMPPFSREFYLRHFDADGDGKLDEREWQAVSDFTEKFVETAEAMEEEVLGDDDDGGRRREIMRRMMPVLGQAMQAVQKRVPPADGDGPVFSARDLSSLGNTTHDVWILAMLPFEKQAVAANNGQPGPAACEGIIEAFETDMRGRIQKHSDKRGQLSPEAVEKLLTELFDELGLLKDGEAATKPASQPASQPALPTSRPAFRGPITMTGRGDMTGYTLQPLATRLAADDKTLTEVERAIAQHAAKNPHLVRALAITGPTITLGNSSLGEEVTTMTAETAVVYMEKAAADKEVVEKTVVDKNDPMTFWENTRLAGISLDGTAVISRGERQVRAARAYCDFATNLMTLTGPGISTPGYEIHVPPGGSLLMNASALLSPKPASRPASGPAPVAATARRASDDEQLPVLLDVPSFSWKSNKAQIADYCDRYIADVDKAVTLSDEQKQAMLEQFGVIFKECEALESQLRIEDLSQALIDAVNRKDIAQAKAAEEKLDDAIAAIQKEIIERKLSPRARMMTLLTAKQRVAWRTAALIDRLNRVSEPIVLNAEQVEKFTALYADQLKDDTYDDPDVIQDQCMATYHLLRTKEQERNFYLDRILTPDNRHYNLGLRENMCSVLTDEQKDTKLKWQFARCTTPESRRHGGVVPISDSLSDEQLHALVVACETAWAKPDMPQEDIYELFEPVIGTLSVEQKNELIREPSQIGVEGLRFAKGWTTPESSSQPASQPVKLPPGKADASDKDKSNRRMVLVGTGGSTGSIGVSGELVRLPLEKSGLSEDVIRAIKDLTPWAVSVETQDYLDGKSYTVYSEDNRKFGFIRHGVSEEAIQASKQASKASIATLVPVEKWMQLNKEQVKSDANGSGRSLVHYAAVGGRIDVLEHLKEQGADFNARDNLGNTPAHWAARYGDVEALAWLKAQGVKLDAKDHDGRSLMYEAAEGGKLVSMKWLNEQGVAVDVTNNVGMSIMFGAAHGGNVEVLRWLKDQGVKVDVTGNHGSTPMFSAARSGHVEAMAWLASQGVEANVKNDSGETPMFAAAGNVNGGLGALKWLKEQGLDVNATCKRGRTPMFSAAWSYNLYGMKWLREQGADINVTDDTGQTPLFWLAEKGNIEAMAWLKEQGADLNVKNKAGRTPLSVTRNENAKKWLRDNGAKE